MFSTKRLGEAPLKWPCPRGDGHQQQDQICQIWHLCSMISYQFCIEGGLRLSAPLCHPFLDFGYHSPELPLKLHECAGLLWQVLEVDGNARALNCAKRRQVPECEPGILRRPGQVTRAREVSKIALVRWSRCLRITVLILPGIGLHLFLAIAQKACRTMRSRGG